MNIRFDLKDYVVIQLLLPDLGKWGFVRDFDSLDEALRAADRSKGQLVVHVPKDARMQDGAMFVLDTETVLARSKIVGN